MEVRLLREDDYDNIVRWGIWHRFAIPLKEILPEMGTGGLMVSNDGFDICSGYIFFTNSKIAWIEFICSNPEYRNKDRQETIVYLIECLCYTAKQKGYTHAFTSLKRESLVQHYEKAGFVKGSSNTTEMTIIL